MYPQRELIRLGAYKAALRRDIAFSRVRCAEAAARAVQPLEWFDRVLDFCRRLSPFAQIAAIPLGLLVQRTVFPRRKILGSLLRWAPLVFSAVRGLKAAATPARNESRRSGR